MDYEDFEIQVYREAGADYTLIVRSPVGEVRTILTLPFDESALERRLLVLETALLRSSGGLRLQPAEEERTAQDFGRDMFNALFAGEVRSLYVASLDKAVGSGKGLRLRLKLQDARCSALPWEFLYDSRLRRYMCLSHDTPLVRCPELPRPVASMAVEPPLRILGMIANPISTPDLDVRKEMQRLETATARRRKEGLIQLEWLPGHTWRDLQRAMREGPWHVFHFIGHGGFDPVRDEGYLVLENEEGGTRVLHASNLAQLLANHRALRLALLNVCEGARGGKYDVYSSTASVLASQGIPAVLSMQYGITDGAATEFAQTFYEVLTEGHPVDAAVVEARVAVATTTPGTLEWGTPVLHMHSRNGVLVDVQRPLPPASDQQPTAVTVLPAPAPPATGLQEPIVQKELVRPEDEAKTFEVTDAKVEIAHTKPQASPRQERLIADHTEPRADRRPEWYLWLKWFVGSALVGSALLLPIWSVTLNYWGETRTMPIQYGNLLECAA